MLGEALGAVAALQEKSLAGRHLAERPFQLARLPGEHEGREAGELLLDRCEHLPIRKIRHLLDRQFAPARRHPTLAHRQPPRFDLAFAPDEGHGL
jgi:hypothetical protein